MDNVDMNDAERSQKTDEKGRNYTEIGYRVAFWIPATKEIGMDTLP